MSKKIRLECGVCGRRNYKTTRPENKQKRMEIKKYCPHCRTHTIHRESV